jgi:hypothetical protein
MRCTLGWSGLHKSISKPDLSKKNNMKTYIYFNHYLLLSYFVDFLYYKKQNNGKRLLYVEIILPMNRRHSGKYNPRPASAGRGKARRRRVRGI